MAKTIIINRMFTGNYLEQGKNIGHEIINLFRPDAKNEREQPFQIYLMSGGDYPYDRYQSFFGDNGQGNNIEAILFSRSINSNCIEITAKATGVKPVFIPSSEWKGEYSSIEIRNLASKMLTSAPKWWEKLTSRTKKLRLNKLGATEQEVLNALEKLVISVENLHKELEIDDKRKEWVKIADFLYRLADVVKDSDEDAKKDETYKKGVKASKVVYKLSKAMRFRAIHIKQMSYIIENNITYKGVRLDKLYQNNTEAKDGIAIYVTFTADSVVKTKKSLYIVTNEAYKRIGEDNFVVEKGRVSGSSSATYYDYEEIKGILDDKYWEQESVKEVEEQLDKLSDNFNFLAMLGKEDDELAFSNMFAHFFSQDEQFFKSFAKEILKIDRVDEVIEIGVDIGDFTEDSIQREYKNIDLLITGNNYVITIENKIKSGINGERHDIYGETISNQLDKYYNHIEDNYADKQTRKYFLFCPNYNPIDVSKFSSEGQKAFREGLIYYKAIYDFCSKYFEENKNKMNPEKCFYFHEFVKALAKHSKIKDSDHENISLIRMREIIRKIDGSQKNENENL